MVPVGGNMEERKMTETETALELMRANMLANIIPDEQAQRGLIEAFITLVFTS